MDSIDGGAGGGNGGTFASAPSAGLQSAGSNTFVSPMIPPQGGYTGDSCSSGRAESTVFVPNGSTGTGGTNFLGATDAENIEIPARPGQITLLGFSFDPARTASIPNITASQVTVAAPTTIPPGYDVTSYAVTCTSATGAVVNGAASAAVLTSPVNIAMSLSDTEAWTCEVTAVLTNPLTNDTIRTIPTTQTKPVVTPPVDPADPGAAKPVPSLAGWSLIMLSFAVGLVGFFRRGRFQKL